MGPQEAVTLELYVATPRHCDRSQYLASQYALLSVIHYGLREVIEFVPLDRLNKTDDFLDITKKPAKELRLPFLVNRDGNQATILGSGLGDVIEALDNLYL